MKVTNHFDSAEWACKDKLRTRYPADWVESRLRPLCETLEVIRAKLDQPLRIVSGYRTPEHNRSVGGAADSRHMHGDAADVSARDASAAELYLAALQLYEAGKLPHLGGIGVYRGWVHIDCRPRKADGSIARWRGKGVE